MNWLLTTLIRAFSFLLNLTPRFFQMKLGQFLGLIWFHVVRIRRDVVFSNLKLAFPEKSDHERYKIAQANYMNYGCGFIEAILLPSLPSRFFKKWVIIEGMENYNAAMAEARGLFFLTMHIGSWEFMSAAGIWLGVPLHVIVKKFRMEGINKAWVKVRTGTGLKLISEEKSSFEILRIIKRKEVVGFILDQFMGPPPGVRTQFFNVETGTAGGLALFADRTRVPVLAAYNIREKSGHIRIVFGKPIEFVEQGSTAQNISFMTQVYTSKIEDIVRKHPEQWLWLHRRWKPFRDA